MDDGACRLFAVEDGYGPALMLAHGGLANHEAVLPILAPLADRYHVIAPDLRGSGRSHFSEELTFDRMAGDLACLLDRLSIRRAFIGGISSGSGTAVRFALRYPERIQGLILLKPIYAGADVGYTKGQAEAFSAMDSVASQAADDGVEVLRPLFAGLPDEIRQRAWRVAEKFDAASVTATSRFIVSGAQPFNSCRELHSIAAPTLLVRGDDEQHPAVTSDVYARCIRNCSVLPATTMNVGTVIGEFCDGVIKE
jgi:pimeloyl-ACP methyl ester carboxylesterase